MGPKRSSVAKGMYIASSYCTREQPIIPVEEVISAMSARLWDVEENEWLEKVKGRGFIVEKSIHADLEGLYPLRPKLYVLSWGPILDIRGSYFLEFVWEFHANILDKGRIHTDIEIKSKGRTFFVSTSDISALLQVPDEGPSFEFRMGRIHSEIGLHNFEAVLGYHFQSCLTVLRFIHHLF